MKFLGNISHLSSSGRLIARSSQSPPSGISVFNKKKKKIGKVVDVFGPTKEPYISVGVFKSINIEDFENSIGEDLYMSDNFKKNRKNSKNKSRRDSDNRTRRDSSNKSRRDSSNRTRRDSNNKSKKNFKNKN